MAVDLTPTAAVAAAARRGLRLVDDGRGGDGLVPQTITDARKMAERESLSEDKVRRMPAWFARHESDKRPGWDDPGDETPGFVAWLLWGGDAGRRWAEMKVRQMDREDDAMGRDMADAAHERRDLLDAGDKNLADALIDGVEQTGRYDAQAANYVGADQNAGGVADGRACQFCVFYRGDTYAPTERCVIVAAPVEPGGGCRLGIYGELDASEPDDAVDPTMPAEPQSLDDALESVDDALANGEQDSDDDDDGDVMADGDPDAGVNVVVNVSLDVDAGENHNAEGGSVTVTDGDAEVEGGGYRSHEIHASPVATAEWRESGAGSQYRTLSGYASVFSTPSDDLGGFREIIAPAAFTRALDSPDLSVALLWNHDPDSVMASTRNGTLELEQDRRGLRMWARVNMDDFDAQRVVSKIRSGLVDQMSFAFTVADDGDEWTTDAGYPLRVVRDIDALYDVSAVTYPAYPRGTKVEVLDRAIRCGRVPQTARATPVAQADPAGTPSSLSEQGEALNRLRARTRARLHIVKFDLSR